MKLLIANANTSTRVTDIVTDAARRVASPGTELALATAIFGARIIASRTEIAIAQHAVLDAMARHADDCDGVLIAASYDCGLRAARELTGKPVVALTEASLLAAMTVGERIGLVIWGKGAAALHHEVIDNYGFAGRICGTRRLDLAPLETKDDADKLDAATVEASRALVDQHEADVILLLGAMFSGRSFLIEDQVDAPVLDGVRCALPLLEAMVRMRPKRSVRGSYILPRGRECCGLSPDLERQISRADGVSRDPDLGD